jgi:hypothetical protein
MGARSPEGRAQQAGIAHLPASGLQQWQGRKERVEDWLARAERLCHTAISEKHNASNTDMFLCITARIWVFVLNS